MKKNNKKPFFLKRWLVGLFGWMDRSLFSVPEESPVNGTLSLSVSISTLIGLISGIIMGAVTTFAKHPEKFVHIFPSVVAGIVVIVAGYFIYKGCKELDATTGMKVLRSAVLLVASLIFFGIGLFVGVWGFIIVAILVVGWIILFFMSDGNTRKNDVVILEDGTELKKYQGLGLTPYWADTVGNRYEENSNGTFSKVS